MSVLEKKLYGAVCIPRAYCKQCGETSFIVGGLFTCCGSYYQDTATRERIKRECITESQRSAIPKKIMEEILDEQKYRCIYCDRDLKQKFVWRKDKGRYGRLKIHFDHFVPWISSGDNNKHNLYASCNLCNQIKSDRHFIDVASAKIFILERLKQKV